MVSHYKQQLTHLRIQRMRIMARPLKTKFDYVELEEVCASINDYKHRIERVIEEAETSVIVTEPDYNDSRIFDL
jgi:hypothetical protein